MIALYSSYDSKTSLSVKKPTDRYTGTTLTNDKKSSQVQTFLLNLHFTLLSRK